MLNEVAPGCFDNEPLGNEVDLIVVLGGNEKTLLAVVTPGHKEGLKHHFYNDHYYRKQALQVEAAHSTLASGIKQENLIRYHKTILPELVPDKLR